MRYQLVPSQMPHRQQEKNHEQQRARRQSDNPENVIRIHDRRLRKYHAMACLNSEDRDHDHHQKKEECSGPDHGQQSTFDCIPQHRFYCKSF